MPLPDPGQFLDSLMQKGQGVDSTDLAILQQLIQAGNSQLAPLAHQLQQYVARLIPFTTFQTFLADAVGTYAQNPPPPGTGTPSGTSQPLTPEQAQLFAQRLIARGVGAGDALTFIQQYGGGLTAEQSQAAAQQLIAWGWGAGDAMSFIQDLNSGNPGSPNNPPGPGSNPNPTPNPEPDPDAPPPVDVAGGLDLARLNLDALDLAQRMKLGQMAIGQGTMDSLIKTMADPYSVVPAMMLYSGAGKGEPLAPNISLESTGGIRSPYGPLVEGLVGGLYDFATGAAPTSSGMNETQAQALVRQLIASGMSPADAQSFVIDFANGEPQGRTPQRATEGQQSIEPLPPLGSVGDNAVTNVITPNSQNAVAAMLPHIGANVGTAVGAPVGQAYVAPGSARKKKKERKTDIG